MKTTALVFACHEAACAPPPAGVGGSLKAQGAVGRAFTKLALRLQGSRDRALTKRGGGATSNNAVGVVTHVSGMGQVTVTAKPPSAVRPGNIVLHNLRGWRVTQVRGGSRRGDRVITVSDSKGEKDEVFLALGDKIGVIT